MKETTVAIFAAITVVGCAQNQPATSPAAKPTMKAEFRFACNPPHPRDIVAFTAAPLPSSTHFKNFVVDRKKLEEILCTWHQVSHRHWRHGYHHVAGEDRTGTITLRDGSIIRWMVKPGGLAALTYQPGTVIYLAKELTPWRGDAEPDAAPDKQ